MSGCTTHSASSANAESSPTASAPTPAASPALASLSAAAQHYLALATTLDTAGAAAREHLSLSMTGVAYASLVANERDAAKRFEDGLEQFSWPADAAIDMASLISANRAVIVDDQAIAATAARQPHPDPSAVDATVGADERRLLAASAAVRADLGLPPASAPPS